MAASIGVLLGLAVAPPSVQATTNTITPPMDFGRVVVGYNSGQDYFYATVCATAGHPSFTIEAASVTGSEAVDFSIPNLNTCNNQFLDSSYPCGSPQNGCTYLPVFQPTTYGNLQATLLITTDLGDIEWVMKGTGGIILVNGQPTDAEEFPIAASGPLGIDEATDPIAFSATGVGSSQTVTWKTTLNYQTSGGVPEPPPGYIASNSFKTTGTTSSSQAYTSEGGLFKIFATVGTFTDEISNDEVVGVTPPTGIPYSTITSQLESLYSSVSYVLYNGNKVSFSPATPELMAQVATVESSERQFANEGLYYSDSSWPLESLEVKNRFGRIISRTGAHIGMMQVPVTMADAWDWLQNAHDGVLLPNQYSFQEKLSIAYGKSVALGKKHNLTLSSCQLEEMALELNGPFAKGPLSLQYYKTQLVNGSLQWVINTDNACGVCYVINVRNTVSLGGGSTSSYPATPSIPEDPPTSLQTQLSCSACKQ